MEDPTWLKALNADPAVTELSRGLELSDGFDLYVTVVPTPRTARGLFACLPGGHPRQRLDPYVGWDLRRPMSKEELTERVLGPLLATQPETGWIVDASRASREDRDAWAYLFGRMNERRNSLQAHLGTALVICLPTELERCFAEEAPDLWSVRSAVLSPQVRHPLAQLGLLGAPLPWPDQMEVRDPRRRVPELDRLLIILDDVDRIYTAHNWLPEWASPYLSSMIADGEYDKVLRLAQQTALNSQRSDYHPSIWYELAPWQFLSAACSELGDRSAALAACIEGLARYAERGNKRQTRVDPTMPLLLRTGDIHLERGRPKAAEECYRKVLGRRDSLWMTSKYHIAAALVRLQPLQLTLAAMEKTHQRLLRIASAPRLGSSYVEKLDIGWVDAWDELDLAVLQRQGDWQLARGDRERALLHYVDMSARARELDPEQVPRRPWGRYLVIARYLSAAVCSQAHVLVELERPAEACKALEEVAVLWQKLRAQRSLYPPHIASEAQIFLSLAAAYQNQASSDPARGALEAARECLRALYPREADSVLFSEKTRQCLDELLVHQGPDRPARV